LLLVEGAPPPIAPAQREGPSKGLNLQGHDWCSFPERGSAVG
jgi:hypothetical protein